jgi:hypothetical protein
MARNRSHPYARCCREIVESDKKRNWQAEVFLRVSHLSADATDSIGVLDELVYLMGVPHCSRFAYVVFVHLLAPADFILSDTGSRRHPCNHIEYHSATLF